MTFINFMDLSNLVTRSTRNILNTRRTLNALKALPEDPDSEAIELMVSSMMLRITITASNKFIVLMTYSLRPSTHSLMHNSTTKISVKVVLKTVSTACVSSEVNPSSVNINVFVSTHNIKNFSMATLKMNACIHFLNSVRKPLHPCSQISKSWLLRLDITLLVRPLRYTL